MYARFIIIKQIKDKPSPRLSWGSQCLWVVLLSDEAELADPDNRWWTRPECHRLERPVFQAPTIPGARPPGLQRPWCQGTHCPRRSLRSPFSAPAVLMLASSVSWHPARRSHRPPWRQRRPGVLSSPTLSFSPPLRLYPSLSLLHWRSEIKRVTPALATTCAASA